MKQFMSLSALFLGAACLCAHTPSFASNSDTLNKAGQTTGAVVGGTVNAAGDVVQSAGNGLQKIGDSIKKAFNKLTHSGNKSPKNTTNSNRSSKLKKDGTTKPTTVPPAPSFATSPVPTPPSAPVVQGQTPTDPVPTVPAQPRYDAPQVVAPTTAPAVPPAAGSAAAF